MKVKKLFRMVMLIAAVVSLVGTHTPVRAQGLGAQIIIRSTTFWDAVFNGTVNSNRYERWALQLVEGESFTVSAITTSGDLTPDIYLLDADENQAEYFIAHIKKVIKAAAKLGVPVVNTFVGRDPVKSVEENLEKFAKVWPEIINVAEGYNVKVGIENCPMLFTRDEWPGGKNLATTPAIWRKMFEIIPSENFGLNYDPSHLVWQQMDEVKPIFDFSDKLFHIHLKDVKVYRDKLNEAGIMAYPLEYHSPKIPGLGDVDWRGFFSALTSVKYRGPVCIEVEDKAFEGSEKDIKTAILTSRNYLNQFLL